MRNFRMVPRMVQPTRQIVAKPLRHFSLTNANMSIEEAERLHSIMQRFESDPKDMQAAETLFRELNKHGMHLTVVRLWEQHHLGYNNYR